MKQVMRNMSGVAVGAAAAWLTLSRRKRLGHDLTPLNSQLRSQLRAQAGDLAFATADLKSIGQFLQDDVTAGVAEVRALAAILKQSLRDEGAGQQSCIRGLDSVSQRLDDCIAALVSRTQLSQSKTEFVEVDMSSIAGGVLSQLQERDRRRVVVTNVQEGLRPIGDARLLRSLVQLLLGSVWRLTHRTRLATITFTANEQAGGQRVYCLRHNGLGFDQGFAQDLLNDVPHTYPNEELRSAGIDLATVKSIVGRHSGRLWLGPGEGPCEGQGAKVSFTLGPGS